MAEAAALKLGSQAFLAREVLPLVAPAGSYNVITGGLGEEGLWDAPDASPYAATATPDKALTAMMNSALFVRCGCDGERVRVWTTQLAHSSPAVLTDSGAHHPRGA